MMRIKVSEMKAKLRLLDSSRKAHLMRQADRIATELEAQRDLDGVCMVVDMVHIWNIDYLT